MQGSAAKIIKIIVDCINVFFVIYLIGYSTFLYLAVVIGSSELYNNRKQQKLKNTLMKNYYIPVSIIVPAFNEEVTIIETIKSLLSLDYKLYEIIVVDDGSTDETTKKLIETFNMKLIHRPIRKVIKCKNETEIYEAFDLKVPFTLIRKENGRKSDTLNMGINASKYPYFICLDADSILQYDSLSKIVVPVLDSKETVAVGGVVRPSNNVKVENGRVTKYNLPKNILACMQVLEYDRSFLASRILFDKFNGSLIISGAFGLFKKEIVIEAGGYDIHTMGEDMELVVKLHEYCASNKIAYRIRYEADAVCWTQTPESISDLKKQRKRWHLGLFQSMYKHRKLLANPAYGAVSLVSYIYFLIYELLSPFIELLGLATIVTAFIIDFLNLPFMILFMAIYMVFGCILTLTAFFSRVYTADLKITAKDVIKAMLLCIFEVGFLRFILAFVRATAFFGYKSKKMKWGSIERKKVNV